MLEKFFENGNKRIAKLAIGKLAWGIFILVLTQAQGSIALLDFLPQKWLKIIIFSFGVVLTTAKGMEMFFDKTLQMFKNHEIPTGDTGFITKEETNEKTVTN